jgi:hypothetical protein
MHTWFWCGYLKERGALKDVDMLEDNIKVDNKEMRWNAMKFIRQVHYYYYYYYYYYY